MRKSLLLVAPLLAVVACGGSGGGLAATVNGIDITVAEVQAMRITDDAATIDKAAFASDLTDAIIDRAVIGAAKDEFSIAPSQIDVDAKVAELTIQIEAAQGITVEEFFSSRSLPLDRLRSIANQQVVRDKLYDHFVPEAVPATDEDANLLLSSDPVGRINACVSHILVATEQEAIDARARIAGGEEFAAVAAEVGTDGTAAQGGSLGCEFLGGYVSEFATAAAEALVGVVSEPVESQFGWHLILVESREEPSITDLKAEITTGRVDELVDAWLINAIKVATVSVKSQYGTWVTDPNPMVVAPTG